MVADAAGEVGRQRASPPVSAVRIPIGPASGIISEPSLDIPRRGHCVGLRRAARLEEHRLPRGREGAVCQ